MAVTVGSYYLLKPVYARLPRWWTSPLLTVPIVLLVLGLIIGNNYDAYIRDTHWLLMMLGPATVAFALPVFRYRQLIRRNWLALTVGVIGGCAIAMTTSWLLASLFGLDEDIRRSLVARSITTPLAMVVSADVGGVPELTALFVVVTGIAGAALGEILLAILPLRSALARGTLFGVGAHGAGTAKAFTVGTEEGTIASLAMVLAGLLCVLSAPLISHVLA
nr:LrgB family protein [Solimonas marina]